MRITILALATLCVSAPLLEAQQTGSPLRDYTINLHGFAGTSPVGTVLNSGATAPFGTPSFFNRYDTMDPGQPIIWAVSNAVQIGWITSPLNSIDLSPAGLTILLDGTQPSPISSWLRTDAGGKFQISLPLPASSNGLSRAFAMAHFTPSSPEGFYVSQVHDLFFDTVSSLAAGTPAQSGTTAIVTLGDDDSVLRNIGFNFDFFGVTYTQVWIGSNGYVTFGGSDIDYTPSVGDLVTGPRRIAALWTDLNPSAGGQVTVRTTTSVTQGSTMKILWNDVPYYVDPSQRVTFAISIRENSIGGPAGTAGRVTIDYGDVDRSTGMTAVANGSGVIFSNQPVNYTQGPTALTGAQIYEEFDTGNPFDIDGQRVTVILDVNGHPTSQS